MAAYPVKTDYQASTIKIILFSTDKWGSGMVAAFLHSLKSDLRGQRITSFE